MRFLKVLLSGSLIVASVFACKPRRDDSDVRSFQSLHKGGISLLWYGIDKSIYICVLKAPLTDVKEIDSLERFRELCAGGRESRLSSKEFATMSSAYLSDTTFKSLIRGQQISDDYTKYAQKQTKEKDLIKQTSAVALIMSQLEALEYQLAKSQAEFDTMESFLVQSSADNKRPTEAQIQEIYGDAYNTVKKTLVDLNKRRPELETSLKSSAEVLEKAVAEFLALREKFEGRILTLIDDIFAKELKKTSLLFENSIDYAIFTNVAVQMGLIQTVGLSQSSVNANRAQLKCEPVNDSQVEWKYVMKGPGGIAIANYTKKDNCEDSILTYRQDGLVCSDVIIAVQASSGVFIGDAYNDFELCDVAAAGATSTHLCAPFTNSFDSSESGIFSYTRLDQVKSDRFENSPVGLKQCIEHIHRQAQIDVAVTLFRNEIFTNLIRTPTSATKPSASQSGNNNQSGNQGNTQTGNAPTGNAPTANTPPATPPTQPPAASGPRLTPVPETLAVNSELAVDDIVDAMKKIKEKFKVDDSTRDGCLQATMSSSTPWSDIMAHYYCQYPIYDSGNTASVRACFTGTLRGQGGYSKKEDFRAAFDACINRMEFNWVRSNSLIQFQYIMMSQRDIKDAGKVRFTAASQKEALQKFYGTNIPVRRP